MTPRERTGEATAGIASLAGAAGPRGIGEVTSSWIEASLARAGIDARLNGFASSPLGAGLMGNTYRLMLDYAKAPPDAPASLVFKCTGDSPLSRRLGKRGYGVAGRPGFYGAEVRFYAEIRDAVSINAPRALATWLSDEEDEFGLLLQDFANARAGDEFQGCSIGEMNDVMAGLAGLHAPFWNDPVFSRPGWLQRLSLDVSEQLQANIDRAMVRMRENLLDLFPREDAALVERFAPHYARWTCGAGENVALTHNDYRLDNMLFEPDGRSVVLDWQTLAAMHPGRDTGLFLGCSVATDMRRSHEETALRIYHGRMRELGVTGYSLDECYRDFRYGVLIGLQNVVIGMSAVTVTDRGTQMFLNKLSRCCATIRDHDALAVIGA